MERDFTQELCGWCGFTFSLYFVLFPLLPFYNLIKSKISLEEAPRAYSVLNYINCFCWFLYGDMLYSNQVKYIALIGLISNGVCVSIYIYYELFKYRIDAILNILIVISGSYMMYIIITVIIDDDTLIGKICDSTQFLIFIFPIKTIYRVLKHKNFKLVPFGRAWGSLFMSIGWGTYGIIYNEIYIVIPHCFNLVLSTVQIILFLNYRRKYSLFQEDTNFISIIGISQLNHEENNMELPKTIKVEDNKDNIT